MKYLAPSALNKAVIPAKLFFLIAMVHFFSTFSFLFAEDFQEITVAPGDTLWSISNKYLKDPRLWSEIVKHNKITSSDPTIALPGSKLKIPVLLIKEEYRNALLVGSIPEVRYKRKGENEWHEVKADMLFKYEDSLRTMQGAQARVKFPSKEIVQINENSYVILKPEKILQEIQLLEGDIRASRAKVIMPHGTVVQPKGGRSDYQAKIRPDKTEVVFVYKGKVDVSAQGKTVTVLEGFGTSIPKAAPPTEPMPLPSFEDFNPAELTINGPPPASFDATKGIIAVKSPDVPKKDQPSNRSRSVVSTNIFSSYRLQLSKDGKFEKIVLETGETIGTAIDIKKQNISDGTYYMRVAFIDGLGSLGSYSQPAIITKDTKAPLIKNLVPEDGQSFSGEESYCDVIGTVEDAALITLNEEILMISPTGRFDKFLTLKEGKNVIRILARDSNGNETTITRTLTYTKK